MIDIGISEQSRKEICKRLTILLSNEYLLYTKTLNYHWNVKGKLFGPLHLLFDKQYNQLFEFIDKIAERITALGFPAAGSLQEFLEHGILSEHPGIHISDTDMIANLLKDHETIIKHLRNDIDLTMELNDAGTNNFLAQLIEDHEKIAWMLRAHLES